MARVPDPNVMTTSPMPPATLQALEEQRRKAAEQQGGGDATVVYTLASGQIKPTVRNFAVDTEGGAASDDLTHITGEPSLASAGFPGHGLLVLRAADAARTVVARHLAGGDYSIELHGGADFALDDAEKALVLVVRGLRAYEVTRIYGSDVAARRTALGLGSLATLAPPVPGVDDGKYVGANAGGWSYQAAPAGGSGHKARSLAYAGGNRTYSTGTVLRLEEVDVGEPVTDGYTFSVPAGSSWLHVQALARVEQQEELETEFFGVLVPNHVIIRLAYRPPGSGVFDTGPTSPARGLPARAFQYAGASGGAQRLQAGSLVLAATGVPVAAGGAVRLQLEGEPSTTYRVLGGKTKTWLSLQWM